MFLCVRCENIFVKSVPFMGNFGTRKLFNRGNTACSEARPFFWVLKKPEDFLRECVEITRFNEVTVGIVFYVFGETTRPCSDDGDTGSHRFHHAEALCFGGTQDSKDISRSVDASMILWTDRSKKLHPKSDVEFFCQFFE